MLTRMLEKRRAHNVMKEFASGIEISKIKRGKIVGDKELIDGVERTLTAEELDIYRRHNTCWSGAADQLFAYAQGIETGLSSYSDYLDREQAFDGALPEKLVKLMRSGLESLIYPKDQFLPVIAIFRHGDDTKKRLNEEVLAKWLNIARSTDERTSFPDGQPVCGLGYSLNIGRIWSGPFVTHPLYEDEVAAEVLACIRGSWKEPEPLAGFDLMSLDQATYDTFFGEAASYELSKSLHGR